MSVNPSARQGGLPSEPGYPFGKARNSTVSGALDGYAFEQDYINDYIAYFSMLLVRTSQSPNGSPDTTLAGQQENGLAELVRQSILPVDVAVDAGDTDHDILCPAGVTPSVNMNGFTAQGTALIKQIDAAWTAGDSVGGMLDGAGVQADTWYTVARIRRDSDGVVDVGIDSSESLANIPVGWSAFSRVAAVLTDPSANILAVVRPGDRRTITLETTAVYRKPPLWIFKYLDSIITGGGGGASGADADSAGGCGYSGATAIRRLFFADLSVAETITIGLGGLGAVSGSGNDGTDGGASSIGAIVTAGGGPKGISPFGAALDVLAVATGGDVNIIGSPGSRSDFAASSAGLGGGSFWGTGGNQEASNAGTDGRPFGSGGGGGSGLFVATPGGDGKHGVCALEEQF